MMFWELNTSCKRDNWWASVISVESIKPQQLSGVQPIKVVQTSWLMNLRLSKEDMSHQGTIYDTSSALFNVSLGDKLPLYIESTFWVCHLDTPTFLQSWEIYNLATTVTRTYWYAFLPTQHIQSLFMSISLLDPCI